MLHKSSGACQHLPKTLFVISLDGETALSLLMGFLSFIGMVIMITYTVGILVLRTSHHGVLLES